MRDPDIDRRIDEVGLVAAATERNVAAVLLTYRCTIACRHCLFGCGTDRPDVVMPPRRCADVLAMLHDTGRVVHIAGGEPMQYWDVVRESVRLAHDEGNAPHFLETNASFATTDRVVQDRFRFLADRGVRGILSSSDPFHMEFVPAERFLRVRRIAREIFGSANFWGAGEDAAAIRAFEGVASDPARLRAWVRAHPPILVGAAARELAGMLDSYPADDPRLPVQRWRAVEDPNHCADQFLAGSLWEFHVDPYGNLQTNCGIILGNCDETSPAELLQRGPERANRFAAMVSAGGPRALVEFARREHGFEPPARVAQACELCYRTRRFLRGHYPDVFGPAEVYA